MKAIFANSLIIATFALISFTSWAEPEIKGTPSELATYLASVPGSVQIMGEGEIKTAADRAIISLRVDSENKSLAEALKENQNTRAQVMTFLKEQGIAPDRVQATPFSSTQKHAIFSDKVKSHKVSAILKVTTHDEQEFRVVTRSVDQFPDVAYVQAQFEHSEKEALKARATKKAGDEVKRQKQLFEETLGVKLAVRNIQDQKQFPVPMQVPRYAASAEKYGSPSFTGSTPLPGAREAAASSEEQTPFGELVFSARLLVEYSIERQ